MIKIVGLELSPMIKIVGLELSPMIKIMSLELSPMIKIMGYRKSVPTGRQQGLFFYSRMLRTISRQWTRKLNLRYSEL
jgi:hypothetical protein